MPDDHIRRTKEPVPRSRSGVIGNRSPRAGTEPSNAQSPLRLRLLLSGIFLPLFVAAAVVFGMWAAASDAGDTPGRGALVTFAAVAVALALIAAIDVTIVARRLRRERVRRA
ncbi:DUF6343 family protein [Streptomyces sp. NPDC006333]|uniref:DUF6343 family protein n=1 Tax=Streptomyces sp. NPDC006333 TaxID=3156753 RepID=UPI0033BB7579